MSAPFTPESVEQLHEVPDRDDVTPSGEPEGEAVTVRPPPTRLRKVVKRVGIGVGVLIALYLLLTVIARLMVDGKDDVAFFEARAGDHRPLVFAHQGGEGIRPENTRIAFRESLAVGADVLDTDVHMTRDGVLVLIHDESVDRTSDGSGEVRDLTLAELRELDFGYHFTTDGGETFPYRGTGQTIMTVEELFSEFTDTRFGIEIKQTPATAATGLCELVREFGYEHRVLVSSFSQENMDAFRDSCPSVATSGTKGEVTRFYIFQLLRLNGFYSPPFDSLQVPEYENGTHVLTGSFVNAARRWNLPVVPWTIDEPEDFDRIIRDFDPDGINTNYPDRLVASVEG
jgi:glycerophosphoryl diester phosphodiesterase